MQIQIEENEIQQAIVDYISHLGINIRNKQIDVDMATTRNPKGYSATITILPEKGEQEAEAPESAPADSDAIFGGSES